MSMHPEAHLDECSATSLVDELKGRILRRGSGLCDYCGKASWEPTCRFHHRHRSDSNEGEHAISEDERDLLVAALTIMERKLP